MALRGISGWLVLLAIELHLSPLAILVSQGPTLRLLETQSWGVLTDQAAASRRAGPAREDTPSGGDALHTSS